MKIKTAALVLALLLLYGGVCALTRIAWEDGCSWCVAADTPVYIPGTADEIAVMLPAGTSCRLDASVGDTWQSIEYMIGGRTYTGMVQADSLSRKTR